jgi:hypothetical protein
LRKWANSLLFSGNITESSPIGCVGLPRLVFSQVIFHVIMRKEERLISPVACGEIGGDSDKSNKLFASLGWVFNTIYVEQSGSSRELRNQSGEWLSVVVREKIDSTLSSLEDDSPGVFGIVNFLSTLIDLSEIFKADGLNIFGDTAERITKNPVLYCIIGYWDVV